MTEEMKTALQELWKAAQIHSLMVLGEQINESPVEDDGMIELHDEMEIIETVTGYLKNTV